MPTCSPAAPVPPTFRQPPSGPQDAIVVRAGDRAVLSCETDSLPEPTVTWHKDGQPLGLAQRTQTLLGGQRLEIRDTQVSSPWHGRPWVAGGSRSWRAWAAVWQDVGTAASSAHGPSHGVN